MTSTITPPDQERNHATVLANGQGERLSELDESVILELFKRHGAILFRGFSLDLKEFNAITSRFCSNFVFNESSGRKMITPDRRTQTVNLGQEPFPLHSEISREPWKPDIAWFACHTPPVSGGETLICDGLAVVPALSEQTRRLLNENRLEHNMVATPEECEYWLGTRNPNAESLRRLADRCPFEFNMSNGQYYRTFYAPVLHKPMFSDETAFANFLLFARYYHNNRNFPTFENKIEIPDDVCLELKQVTDRLKVALKWQQSDLLMLDNTRFMHGRNTIEDVNHRVILTQFGFASFAPLDEKAIRAQPWRNQSPPSRGALAG